MKKEEYLTQVRKQILYIFDRDAIEQELKEHIEDSILDFMEDGMSKEEAEEHTIMQMGDPIETGKLLNKEHQPILGYLFSLSKVVMILLGLNIILTTLIITWGLIGNAHPIITGNSISHVPVNMEINMPTHRIIIDNICFYEDRSPALTMREWRKFSYSRAGWSTDYFTIVGTDGERLEGGGGGRTSGLCSNTIKEFDWPEDNILILKFKDGQVFRIDLEEYIDEQK